MTAVDPGNSRAEFSHLYQRYSVPILGYLRRRTGSAEDAADLTAEVFEIAWRRWKNVPEGDQARLWLYGVARRATANHRRRGIRRSEAVRRLAQEVDCATQPATTTTPELDAALGHLKPIDRDIVTMVFWEGFTFAEVAVVMDMPAASVRTRFRRTRHTLELALDEHDADQPSRSQQGPAPDRQSLDMRRRTSTEPPITSALRR